MSELSEIPALPALATASKFDHKFREGKLSLSVTSARPSTVDIPSLDAVAPTDPETESKKPTAKQAPFRPKIPPLVILDLNGCLVYRQYVPGHGKVIKPRPHLDELFQYLSAPHPKGDDSDEEIPNWEFMIWSSAMERNVERMCEAIKISKRPRVRQVQGRRRLSASQNQLNDISNRLDSLTISKTVPPVKDMVKPVQHLAMDVWHRSMLDLSLKDFNQDVSTTKDLRKVWDQCFWTDPCNGSKLKWGSSNTVIVDDSSEKLRLQPDNLYLIDEYKGDPNDKSILELIEKLKSLRNESNIAQAIKNLKENETANAT